MTLMVNFLLLEPKNALKESGTVLLLALSLTSLNCQSGAVANRSYSPGNRTPSKYGYEVVHVFPHDPDAFTQGLEFREGKLLESTGQEGKSSLRSVELETGKVLKKVDVPPPFFAEGITLLNGKIYQLTWQHQLGFIYDYETFQKTGQF